MASTIKGWWRRWQRRGRQDPVAAALRRLAEGPGVIPPDLTAWVNAHELLTPDRDDRAAWTRLLRLYQHTAAGARGGRLPPWAAHAPGRRARPGVALRLGRRLFAGKHRLTVLHHRGQVLSDPAAVEAALWESRAGIWAAPADLSPAAGALLDHYFNGRAAAFPPRPCASAGRLASLVLQQRGSAPGGDGIPYEALQPGAGFVAHLLGQALLGLEATPHSFDRVLGADPDLLIWIPKDATQLRTTDSSRPLQLPTTLRRLGGAVLADIAGPPLEANLSPYQAAVRGGSCGPNISAVFNFLGQGPAPAAPPAPAGDLTASLLGGAAAGADAWLQQFPTWDDSPATAGAALFADQSKAFERLAWRWIAAVLDRWRLPAWLRRGLLGLIVGRRVASRLPNGVVIVRILLCGVGMGGPASPLLWMVSYDPIVYGVACGGRPHPHLRRPPGSPGAPPEAMPADRTPPAGRQLARRPQGRDARLPRRGRPGGRPRPRHHGGLPHPADLG